MEDRDIFGNRSITRNKIKHSENFMKTDFGHYRGGKTNSRRKQKTHEERVQIKKRRKQSAKARCK